MTDLLEQKKNGILGILNGIDATDYNPETDGVLSFPFNRDTLDKKKKNKMILRSMYGLKDADVPLIAMVTRLEYNKGIGLVLEALKTTDLRKFQLILLGSGSPYYQGMLANIATENPDSIAVDFHYSNDLAKKIYAAADIYLMPSLSEPCGIGQLYAMRYGAVTVVNPVGGLKDTVTDDDSRPWESTGFYMKNWSREALVAALERAIKVFNSEDWKRYVFNCMNYESSWKHRVSEYRKLYVEMLK